MGGIIKILAKLIGLLVILIVIAVIVIPLVVDPNDFKDDIVVQVKKHTGRDLTIGGDIGLSIFPWLGLELNQLALSNAPGFGQEAFAAVEHAKVSAKLMPLLSKQLEVDALTIKGLKLNLSRNKSGVANWDDLAGTADPQAPSGKVEEGKGSGLAGLAIGGVAISDAEVIWDDRAAGQRYAVQGFTLTTGAIHPGKPVTLALGFNVDSAEPKLKARLDLEGIVALAASGEQLTLSPVTLKVAELETGEGISGGAELKAAVELDLAGQIYKANQVNLAVDAKGEAFPGGRLQASLVADALVNLTQQTLELSGVKLNSGELAVTADVKGTNIQTAPAFSGNIKLAEFNLRQWLQAAGMALPPMADPATLQRLSLSSRVGYKQEGVSLDGLQLVLDDTTVKGNAKILLGKALAYRFNLELDAINADRYLPPPAPEGSAESPAVKPAPATTPPAGKPTEEAELFPVEMLRQLDLDGSVRLGQLIINKLTAKALEVKVKSKGGQLNLDSKVNQFYQGSAGATLDLNVAGKTPTLRAKKRIASIKAGPLVKDLTGKDRFDGTGDFNADITASGQTVSTLKKTLNGKLDFSFKDGSIKGFNLAQMIRDARAKLSGGAAAAPGDAGMNQTDFSELTGSAAIVDGVLDNQDLLAKSPYLRITGAGKVNLVAESLDYLVKPVIVSTEKGQGGEGLDDLKGVPVPVKLSGPWAKPNWKIDLGSAVGEATKAKAKEKIQQKIEEKLPDKLKEVLPGGLKGIFGR